MKRSITRSVAFALFLGVVCFGGWWHSRDGVSNTSVQRGAVETLAPSNAQFVANDYELEGSTRAASETDVRSPINAFIARLRGRVVNEFGAPIDRATVTWTTLIDLGDAPVMNWSSLDWDQVAASTLETTTNERGEFAFKGEPPCDANLASVLWITHTNHFAQPVLLSADRTTWPESIDVALKSTSALLVRIIDASDAAAAGVRVRQLGLAVVGRNARDLELDHAHRLYSREWTTGNDGAVALPRFEGVQVVLASLGSLEAQPWLAREDTLVTEIVLRLSPTFTARGQVRIAENPTLAANAYVDVFAWKQGTSNRLGQMRVAPDLSFGPFALPVVAAEQLDFDLSGAGLEPRRKRFDPPAAGALIEMEFETRVGHSYPFLVVDEQRRPIQGAKVSVSAFAADGWLSTSAQSDAQGLATVQGCFEGTLHARIDATTFVTRRIEGLLSPPRDFEPLEVALQKAGVLEGKCVREGEVVHDFDVLFWTDLPRKFVRTSFFDRSDGSFLIENAPLGELWVLASCAEVVRGEPLRVVVGPETATKITLELPHGSIGFGRVIDATTGVGVENAKLCLWSNVGPVILTRAGVTSATGADGTFELRGLPLGDARFEVDAAGYALQRCATFVSTERHDLGLIALAGRQTLEVILRGNPDTDFAKYELALSGPEHVAERKFDSSGVLSTEGLVPGLWQIGIYHPDGTTQWAATELVPGVEWRVESHVTADRSLTIRVEPLTGEPLPPELEVRCAFESPTRQRVTGYAYLPESGVCEYGFVAASTVTVDIVSSTHGVLGSAHTSLNPGPNEVLVHLSDKRTRVRVVGTDHAPIDGAQVSLAVPRTNRTWRARRTADTNGEATFAGLPFEHLLAALTHPNHGTRIEIPIDIANAGEKPIELVLDARASVRVELRDGQTPLPGVFVRLTDIGGAYNAFEGSSDGNARVEAGRLGEGTYQMQVAHPGIWPVVVAVHALREAPDEVVQLRRLGALELTVRNAAGANLVNSEVALRSLEFNTDVGEWIAAGRVSSSTQALRTDGQGVLRVNGLPRGEYGWSIGGVEGVVSVPPLASVVVPVVVP